jgi:hypothetical protein
MFGIDLKPKHLALALVVGLIALYLASKFDV